MKIIEPSFEILTPLERDLMLRAIEVAGRTCYKSEGKMTYDSAGPFVKNLVQNLHHESVIEHVSLTVRFICDRGVMAELTRHRLSSFSIQSTRYCRYNSDKFGKEITVIRPSFFEKGTPAYGAWKLACEVCEDQYMALIAQGRGAQEARSVLPNSLATEIVMTANLREWRTVFKQRCAKAAHPQMVQLMTPLFETVRGVLPEVFGDLKF